MFSDHVPSSFSLSRVGDLEQSQYWHSPPPPSQSLYTTLTFLCNSLNVWPAAGLSVCPGRVASCLCGLLPLGSVRLPCLSILELTSTWQTAALKLLIRGRRPKEECLCLDCCGVYVRVCSCLVFC